MTHQSLRLGKPWKLFWATLTENISSVIEGLKKEAIEK